MASAELRDELLCSICLNVFADPVTLRCGHNFCRGCINQVLNTQHTFRVYSCPECRERFHVRPVLKRNITLYNVAERFRSTQQHDGEISGVFCSYCIYLPIPAVKTCLLCEASLCDNHLRGHSKEPAHVLTDPSTSLENRKCSVHKKVLEYYCTEDAACICVSCCLIGNHVGHKVESLEETSEKKKNNLREVLQKLNTQREKDEERVQSLEERRRKAQEKASGETERVTALFIDIRRRHDNLEQRVLNEISRQVLQASLPLSEMIGKLKIKKNELSRKMRHIEELCNMTDPLTFLQDPDTGGLCDPEEGAGGDTGGHETTPDIDENVITGMLHAGYSDIMTYLQTVSPIRLGNKRKRHYRDISSPSYTQASSHSGANNGGDNVAFRSGNVGEEGTAAEEEGIYGQGPADILLDVNTAANNLLISDDLKTATWTEKTQKRPNTPEAVHNSLVISSSNFSSGRHYWDVEISRSRWWRMGMCYTSIDRRGEWSYIGDNKKSWGLCGGQLCNYQCSVIHDGKEIQLPHQISSDRFRICLDYEAGYLSFYELCDPIRHLHTFTATFTEPLHAALNVYTGSIKIGGAAVPM